ncbi:MAG: YheU family protein [Gammaproteobacteria bacterium]
MEIPFDALSSEALRAIIEEFVTREGTEYGSTDVDLETKVRQVQAQLRRGELGLSYDEETQSCHLYRIT